MMEESALRRRWRLSFPIHSHLVFVTKDRHRVFTESVLDDARAIVALVCAECGAEPIETNGEDDHVHRLVTYPPKMAILTLVNSLKSVSSPRLRQNHPDLARPQRRSLRR